MAEIELFHGSRLVVERPQFGMGKVTNDYGQGFYCTQHRDLAAEWACAEEADGKVNRYVLLPRSSR